MEFSAAKREKEGGKGRQRCDLRSAWIEPRVSLLFSRFVVVDGRWLRIDFRDLVVQVFNAV